MKKLFLTLSAIIFTLSVFSQTLPQIEGVKLDTKEDYKAAEPLALQVANYLLSTPSDANSAPRLNSTQFLLKWMGGTPDHSFSLEQKVIKYFEKDLDLTGVYLASLTLTAIQDPSLKDTRVMSLNAAKKLIAYIDNADNHAAMTSKLKKLSEANQKGELETFLKL